MGTGLLRDGGIARGEADVIIIGGGPAGSAAAIVLAQRGISVLLLERHRFPRFHIGESMLTYTAEVLRRLGVEDKVAAAGFPVKTGAEFCAAGESATRVDFTDQGDGRRPATYQVERGDFDSILFDRAEECGAVAIQEARVTGVITEEGRVTGVTYSAGGERHEVKARWVIDASGRAGVISKGLLKSRVAKPPHTVAVFRHYSGVDEATNPGVLGDIQVGTHADGWMWAIPVRADKLSIGTVVPAQVLQRAASSAELFDEHVVRVPRINCRIAGVADHTDTYVESDFTYCSEQMAGPGFLIAGDAGAFTNPIFSAGVYLALVTGSRAGEMVIELLAGSREEALILDEYDRFYKTGYDTYTRLIHGFCGHDYSLGRFLKSTGARVDSRWIARLLGGDFWSAKNPLGRFLRSVRDDATFAPYEPFYGCPVYPELDAAEPGDTRLDRREPATR